MVGLSAAIPRALRDRKAKEKETQKQESRT
jgi:hypothetical protein